MKMIDPEFQVDGYKVLRGLKHVFEPVRQKVFSLFSELFPDCPPIENTEAFGQFLHVEYERNRLEVLKIYDALDRTIEMVSASVHPDILSLLPSLGLQKPMISSYPTWRLDVSNNPPSRWFGWHQDKYHELFADSAVALWVPLHPVGPKLKSSSLFLKKGSHVNGVYSIGKNKFDIIDERVTQFPEVGPDLDFGDMIAFFNLTVHRSGVITEPAGMRLSLQFRYDDLDDPAYKKQGWPRNFKLVDSIDQEKYGIGI